jgi:hypothetical protein
MANIPTVEINRGGHRLIINQSDYRPGVDALWGDAAAPTTDPLPSEDSPNAKEQPQGLRDEIETPQAEKTETLDLVPIEARLAELQALATDWRAIKAIAEGYGITRPADGWDASVLPILVAEYGQSAAEEVFTSPEVTE